VYVFQADVFLAFAPSPFRRSRTGLELTEHLK